MNEQTFLGLPMDFFAQQPGADGKVVFSNAKTSGLSVEAQNMIDAFGDMNDKNWNLLARMLKENKLENFGRVFKKLVDEWESAIVD